MATYSLNPVLFNIANDVMCTAEEQMVLGKLLLTCVNKINEANIYHVPVETVTEFEMAMFNLIANTTGIKISKPSLDTFEAELKNFEDELKNIDATKRIDACNALIKTASEFNFNINVSTLKDFFGSCWNEMEMFDYHLDDKTRIHKKNLLLLGALSDALINVTDDFDYREDIYNDILSYEEVKDAVAEWLNGKRIFQYDETTIATLVNIVYIYSVPAIVASEAMKLIADRY